MTTLTDTQLIILTSAAQRADLSLELPERLKGQAARNTLDRLIRRGLAEEIRAAPGMPVWRRDEEGAHALRITAAALSTC